MRWHDGKVILFSALLRDLNRIVRSKKHAPLPCAETASITKEVVGEKVIEKKGPVSGVFHVPQVSECLALANGIEPGLYLDLAMMDDIQGSHVPML